METLMRKIPGRKSQGSYLLEVLATNKYQGRHILLHSHRDAVRLGLRPAAIPNANCQTNPVLRGLKVCRVPVTNGEIPGQQEVIDHFLHCPETYSLQHRPVVGKILTGPFAGEHIALFSTKEIRHHFSINTIRTCSQYQHIYAGIGWREAVNHADAEQYYYRPEHPALLNLFKRRHAYLHKVLTRAEQHTFGQQLLDIRAGLDMWLHDSGCLATLTLAHYRVLLGWYDKLERAIQCHVHYVQVKDTLMMLKHILAKGDVIKPLLFMGHCKILERFANDIRRQ